MNETPECFTHKNGKWSVEFRNPITAESIVVTYSGLAMPAAAEQPN